MQLDRIHRDYQHLLDHIRSGDPFIQEIDSEQGARHTTELVTWYRQLSDMAEALGTLMPLAAQH
jgi:hypothetical protein